MKKIFVTLFLLMSLVTKAQIAPLFEHTWRLEKVIIDDEEIAATQSVGSTEFDDWAHIYFYESGFSFVDTHPVLEFNDENLTFSIIEMYLDLGSYHSAASTDAFGNFIKVEDIFEEWNNPFSYLFRYENQMIYLDITNSNGDLATFFAITLSNTNFKQVVLTIYPNPTSNLLHIETSQIDITAIGIFDLHGKRVMQLNSSNLRDIDVSHLTNGMYFIKVSTSDGELTKKFVKK